MDDSTTARSGAEVAGGHALTGACTVRCCSGSVFLEIAEALKFTAELCVGTFGTFGGEFSLSFARTRSDHAARRSYR